MVTLGLEKFPEYWGAYKYPKLNLKKTISAFLRYRNAVAHGADISNEEVIIQDVYSRYRSLVRDLMYGIHDRFSDGISNKSYKKTRYSINYFRKLLFCMDSKVILVSPTPTSVGGIATWTSEFLKALPKYDMGVILVDTSVIGDRSKTNDSKASAFIEIKRCCRIWGNTLFCLIKEQPQLMHLNTSCSRRGIYRDFLCAVFAKMFGKPIVLHCHCNVNDQLGNDKYAVSCFHKLCNLCSRVLVLNNSSKEYVDGLSNTETAIMPNFISANFISHGKIINNSIKRIVYVGQVRKSKGIDSIIEVAKNNKGIEFDLVGPLTSEYDEAALSSIENIVLHGAQNKEYIKNILDNADLFLFPTKSEGFSLALLEAMARGLPVITTDVGANKDMIEDKGGVIVPINNSNAIDTAIQRMADKNIREQMSKFNVEKVKRNYTIDIVMQRLTDLYKLIIDKRK